MTTIILIRKHLLTELLNTKPIKIGCEHVGCESERGRTWVGANVNGRERTRIQTMYQWEIYKPFYGIYLYNSGSLDLFICLKKKTQPVGTFTSHTHIYEYQLYAYETCCIVKLITVCENQDLHKNYPNIRDSGVIFPQSFQLFDLIHCSKVLLFISVW